MNYCLAPWFDTWTSENQRFFKWFFIWEDLKVFSPLLVQTLTSRIKLKLFLWRFMEDQSTHRHASGQSGLAFPSLGICLLPLRRGSVENDLFTDREFVLFLFPQKFYIYQEVPAKTCKFYKRKTKLASYAQEKQLKAPYFSLMQKHSIGIRMVSC